MHELRGGLFSSKVRCGCTVSANEVHLSNGLPSFTIVGMAQTAVKESRDRVRSALMNNNYYLPVRRITVSLAPADLPKEGARFDLPIALGILLANEDIVSTSVSEYEFLGELSLTGQLQAVSGALPFVLASRQENKKVILPRDNAHEVEMVAGCEIYLASCLAEIVRHFAGVELLPLMHSSPVDVRACYYPDMRDVHGQTTARRAMEVAASGEHSVLLQGPPGQVKACCLSDCRDYLPPWMYSNL